MSGPDTGSPPGGPDGTGPGRSYLKAIRLAPYVFAAILVVAFAVQALST